MKRTTQKVRRLNVRRAKEQTFYEKYLDETSGTTVKRDLRLTVKFFASQIDMPQKTVKTLLDDIKNLRFNKKVRRLDKQAAYEEIAERIANLPGVWEFDEQREGQFLYIDHYMDAKGKVRKLKRLKPYDFYDMEDQSDEFRNDAYFNADKAIIAVLNKFTQYPDIGFFDNMADGVPMYVLNMISILQQYVPFDLYEYMFDSIELDPSISTANMQFYTVRYSKRFKELLTMWQNGKLPKKFDRFYRKLKNIL